MPRRPGMKIGSFQIGGNRPFFIAGPCVIESERHCLRIAECLARIAARLEIALIFKASYDKANRTALRSFRGPGIEEGLRILEKVRDDTGLPVLSDVHETHQVAAAAEVSVSAPAEVVRLEAALPVRAIAPPPMVAPALPVSN